MDAFIRFHSAGDITVKAGKGLGPRQISDYELVYFPIATRSVYTVNDREHRLDMPCVLFTRPGERHTYRFDLARPTRHIYIHFDLMGDWLRSRYPLLLDGSRDIVRLPADALIPTAMRQLLYHFYRKRVRWRPLAEMLLLTVLEEMESHLTAAGDASTGEEQTLPPQIASAIQSIEDHVREGIEVERLAGEAGWTHEHFTRMFQRYVGHSPKEWIIKRRIELATQLLLQRTDSIKTIARSIGFADEYYFHRLFRKTTGMTATEYRRRYGDPRMRELAPPDDKGRFYPLNHSFALRADEEG